MAYKPPPMNPSERREVAEGSVYLALLVILGCFLTYCEVQRHTANREVRCVQPTK